jgi:reactive intermediate/imine deaminase
MEAIDSPDAPPKAGPFSHLVKTGNLVFLSGQGPFDPRTNEIPPAFDDQVRLTLRNIETLTRAAGGSLRDIVRVGVYLRDIRNFDAMNRIYEEVFSEPYPARTTIQSDMTIEVEIDAVMELPG